MSWPTPRIGDFPFFPPDVLEELFEFGERRELAAGDVLYRAGQSNSDFFVLIDGEAEVVRDDESHELVVVYTQMSRLALLAAVVLRSRGPTSD